MSLRDDMKVSRTHEESSGSNESITERDQKEKLDNQLEFWEKEEEVTWKPKSTKLIHKVKNIILVSQ